MDSFICRSDFSPSAAQQAAPDDEPFTTVATRPPKRRAGRKKFLETRHPIYKGIRRKNHGKWVCEIREPSKQSRIWLGTFQTAEMAARAHDVAAIALRGRSACLNFADSAQLLPVPASTNAKDIQKAAAEAAEAFRPASSQWNGISEHGAVLVDYLMDEEAFDGIGLIDSMAEGLMLSPPWSGYCCDDVEGEADVLLWSHSI